MLVSAEDIKNMDQKFRALFVNSLSGFKSANLVGTQDNNGTTNLSIVSSVFHIGASPPLMGMIHRPETERSGHTIQNIRETGEYTLNHVNSLIIKQAHQTSAKYPKETSEFDAVGLSLEWSEQTKAPFVEESHIQLGLELREINHLEINGTYLIIGEITEVRLVDGIVGKDGFVDIEKASSVVVSSLDSYHVTEALGRLSYAKPDKPVTVIR